MTIKIAILGYGKIAADQHVPSIAATPGCELVAVISRRGVGPDGVPAFTSLAEMIASKIEVDAVALCNRPDERIETAREAIAAGLHVFLEKPPATTLGAAAALRDYATAQGVTLFASWHARANAAVEQAKAFLATRAISAIEINWLEDVEKWHPGQSWIWAPGGFGVYDPGINALSILTHIVPFAINVKSARHEMPHGVAMPIRAEIDFDAPDHPVAAHAVFDWSPVADEDWSIRVTSDAGLVVLDHGGKRLSIDGQIICDGADEEYARLYGQFADLVTTGQSDVDLNPLRIVADAFMIAHTEMRAPLP
jgi:D-galactose 1-dehydrogenase